MIRALTPALVLIGLATLIGQILLIRELLIVFHGNELSTSVVLAAWLLWSALGSFWSAALNRLLSRETVVLAVIQAFTALLLPLSVLGARLAKTAWGVPVGEMVRFDQMIMIAIVVLGPFCFFAGMLFALGCRAWVQTARFADRAIGQVYWLEALGAGLGGLLFSLWLVHRLNHLQIALLVAAAMLWTAVRLFFSVVGRLGPRSIQLTAVLTAMPLLILCYLQGTHLERITRQWQWQGYDLIDVTDTLYGNLAAVRTGAEISFYENGLWMFTYPDPLSAEHSVHFALLAHPRPEQVLLIGGSLSGSLEQVLKHPSIERVDCVELDPGMIRFGRNILPIAATDPLDHPKVRLLTADGRRTINTTSSRYDVVIINLPDPKTAQLNRFYTEAFFREAGGILREGGLVAVSLSASESIISPTLAQLLSSLYRTLNQVFPQVATIPGTTAFFFGSFTDDPEYGLSADPAVFSERIQERDLQLAHVRDYYLRFNLSQGRRSYFTGILEAMPGVRINRDLAPSSYFYDLIRWSASWAPTFGTLLVELERLNRIWLILVPALFALGVKIANDRRDPLIRLRFSLKVSCLVMGFSEMALTVMLMLVFQVFYGYLYYQLAFLITLYMVGTAAGSRLMAGFGGRIKRPGRLLVIVQSGMGLYAFLLIGVIGVIYASQPQLRLTAPLEYGFGLWMLIAGLIGGLQFPLAGLQYVHHQHETGRAGGILYGMDLAGSAAGAIVTGLVLAPVVGILPTLMLIGVWNLLAVWILSTSIQSSSRT